MKKWLQILVGLFLFALTTGTAAAWTPTGVLTDGEIEGLLYMREEEKLARDVYLTLYETWGLRIFQNISRSEDRHMDAVKTLIDRYDLTDPAEGKDVGEFADQTLQELYNELVAQGSQSLADALRVGAAIEELDIADLQERLGQTEQADVKRVYESLLKGSRNHLRSFVSTLNRQGETYEPQYLDQETYDEIVGSTRGQGPADRERGQGPADRERGQGSTDREQGQGPADREQGRSAVDRGRGRGSRGN